MTEKQNLPNSILPFVHYAILSFYLMINHIHRVLVVIIISLKEKGCALCDNCQSFQNKAGYTATEVACVWAIFEVTRPFGQER